MWGAGVAAGLVTLWQGVFDLCQPSGLFLHLGGVPVLQEDSALLWVSPPGGRLFPDRPS